MEHDLTLSEVLVDPLIAQLRQADAVGYAAFAQLLQSASRVYARQMLGNLQTERADAFYRRVDAVSGANKHN
ncbi:hypothetical protein [Neorhizobium galegae]|uniref:Uncharacterized protein n=2 Tax=Neorhizobium galegae TaxID=399 RepID=A0A068SSP4_NEOGA|nr:hypothetical protein [Neorhizobium galegae]KAB1087538.1 hypothetical protein F4V91_14530 [Neorhizobium galegae]MCQ1850981.1 hypothetical protein [Neorhizobium galegae]CDN48786.1 Hypothetical protein RG540_CH26200 [Neorhizobium galegae bv. orientalis str. HAMBI 540]CDZ52375.1 Hypothetical protein NGAL_HAMBI2427_46180 [Neorhizobium galegae bv. orientalis]